MEIIQINRLNTNDNLYDDINYTLIFDGLCNKSMLSKVENGNDLKEYTDFMKSKNIDHIDILHSDIQGYEFEMLSDIISKSNLLKENKIKYLFISTHSDKIHYDCIDLLKNNDYRIIASSDFETETFCYDGIIVACHISNNKFDNYYLGNRKNTKLRKVPY